MVMQSNTLMCALLVLINSQYASDRDVNQQLVNSENWSQKFTSKDVGLGLFIVGAVSNCLATT